MKLIIELEPNEVDSPIRFATATIERRMNVHSHAPDIDLNYRYLKEVNEHINVFLKKF